MTLEEAKQQQHDANLKALGLDGGKWVSPSERLKLTELLYDMALIRLAGWEVATTDSKGEC